MALLIELSPETEARLKAEADAQNVPISEIVQRLVEQSRFATASNTPTTPPGTTKLPWLSLLDLRGVGGAGKWKERGDAQERVNKIREDRDPLAP